jgi:FkbM family methyltransferase
MLPSQPYPTYAQYHEDLVLAALLSDVETGFYVDVGANHESLHSVTRYFYGKGWSGINIEPTPKLFSELVAGRPRDINLNVAVSRQAGKLAFREYPEHDGLSTLNPVATNAALPHVDYEIEVRTLASILSEHGVGRIDFLKVDVEGHEQEVLESNDWSAFRPAVVCVEANGEGAGHWRHYLTEWNYSEFIFEGLNRYYIAAEAGDLASGFADRVAVYEHWGVRDHHYRAWQLAAARARELEAVAGQQQQAIAELQKTLREAGEMIVRLTSQPAG